jgi:predicted DNA binding CopG/RHH family protein
MILEKTIVRSVRISKNAWETIAKKACEHNIKTRTLVRYILEQHAGNSKLLNRWLRKE